MPKDLTELKISIGLLLDAMTRVETTLLSLPCDDHAEKITRLEMQFAALKESSEKFETEKKNEIYVRLRKAENKVTALIEQNKSQDKVSDEKGKSQDKISGLHWLLILSGLNAVTLIAVYYLTRGLSHVAQ